jgi:hypothetical protein
MQFDGTIQTSLLQRSLGFPVFYDVLGQGDILAHGPYIIPWPNSE